MFSRLISLKWLMAVCLATGFIAVASGSVASGNDDAQTPPQENGATSPTPPAEKSDDPPQTTDPPATGGTESTESTEDPATAVPPVEVSPTLEDESDAPASAPRLRDDVLFVAPAGTGLLADLGISWLDSPLLAHLSTLDAKLRDLESDLPEALRDLQGAMARPGGIHAAPGPMLDAMLADGDALPISAFVIPPRDTGGFRYEPFDEGDVNIAMVRSLAAVGEYEAAMAALGRSYDGTMTRLGERHPQTLRLLRMMAEVYEAWGKPKHAEYYRELLRQVVEDQKQREEK